MKTCAHCGQRKPLGDFYARKGRKDGLRSECKLCTKAAAAAWAEANPEKGIARSARVYARNREKRKVQMAAWKAAHPEKVKQHNAASRAALKARDPEYRREYMKAYKAEINPAAVARGRANYRMAKKTQCPAWANDFFISEAYRLAKLREKVVGGKWHVDHVVPLKHKLVCGLHVEHNLAVIPAEVNRRKSNRHWPDMP